MKTTLGDRWAIDGRCTSELDWPVDYCQHRGDLIAKAMMMVVTERSQRLVITRHQLQHQQGTGMLL